MIATSKPSSAVSSEASDPRPFLEQLGWLYVDQGAGKSTIKAFTSSPSSVHWRWKLPTRRVLRRCFCAATCSLAFIVLRKPRLSPENSSSNATLPFDYGLLGDALMEQGRLAEAVAAYQRMVDLRPDLQSYSRVAHIRWLKGDLDGAIEVARLAARCREPARSRVCIVVADTPRALLFPGWLARRC